MESLNKESYKELMSYGFYDESGKYNVVLNKEKLKKLLNADIILLEERTAI